MKVLSVKLYNTNVSKKEKTKSSKVSFANNPKNIIFQDKVIAKVVDPKKLLNVLDQTNEKVSTAIVFTPTDPQFSKLKILIKDGSTLKSDNLEVVADKNKLNNPPTFTGSIYGSIGKTNYPARMEKAYKEFFKKGMFKSVLREFKPTRSGLKEDYNFFVPTDGDGTRFKDYTNLQGGIPKPGAKLPATFNGNPLKLIHATLINFAKTGLVEPGVKFINVDKARGSSYAFLEGLKTGKIPTNKPMVFCWGDNFSDINLKELIKYHEKNNSGVTVLGIPTSFEKIKALGAIHLDSAKGLEIQGFKEKPKEYEDIMKSLIPNTDEHLASVGPFVISKEVLTWLKAKYTKNPSAFLNEKGEYDFSGCILTPLVKILGEGKEIVSKEGKKLPMMAYVKPEGETWSDLGKTTDLIEQMRAVVNGKYSGLPKEIKDSIKKNIDMEKGVISTDEEAMKLFNEFCKKYNIDVKNSNIVVSTL